MATWDEIRFLQAWKKQYERVPEEVIEYRDKQIDEDNKRRQRKGAVADDPKDGPKGRPMGKQDIGDIPYSVNWQSIVRDQLGISLPINNFYKCPVCGYESAVDFPPERCPMCGCWTPLHQRKFIDLKF